MAASNLPIPQPPRTPSPTSDDAHDQQLHGLGLDGPTITTHFDYDIQNGISDSPGKEPDSGSTMLSLALSNTTSNAGLTPNPAFYTPMTPQTASTDGAFPSNASLEPSSAATHNPFNFTPQQYTAVRKPSNEALGKRRGHKYRHSSIHVSAMDSIVPPLSPRTPLSLPSSLPIPTRRETWRSLTSHQTLHLAWCGCHFLVAGIVQFIAEGSLSMTALSRLLFFDAAGATVCVVVDIMSNFEVWKRPSLKHPFGLERADVLAGFALSVFIGFMGLDIFSHGIEHGLENIGKHEPHTSHAHSRAPARNVQIASLLSVISTLVSALSLKNHRRIAKATNIPLFSGYKRLRLLSNPSHILTLTTSLALFGLPLVSSLKSYNILDMALSFFIALLMLTIGARLGTSLAAPLLMSYKPLATGKHAGVTVGEVVREIEGERGINGVDEAKFWQVHYGLFMANLKVSVAAGGTAGDEMRRLRSRITSLVRQRLGGKWEVSLQVAVDRD